MVADGMEALPILMRETREGVQVSEQVGLLVHEVVSFTHHSNQHVPRKRSQKIATSVARQQECNNKCHDNF